MIKDTEDKIASSIIPALGEDYKHLLVFLTVPDGKGRYRDKFNKETTYKASRISVPIPVFMEEMRDFIKKFYIVHQCPSSEYEADDAISWRGWYNHEVTGNQDIIAGVDKDLNQIPGYHWNYSKDSSYYVSGAMANQFFFHQLLTGDVADSIPGIKGIGPRRADNLLKKGTSPEEWWDIVLSTYTNKLSHLSEDEIAEILYERGNKLWIQRHEGQTWYPPIPEKNHI
jgi:5'-3' exonuclease